MKAENPNAFPSTNHNSLSGEAYTDEGMTLRDYLAAKAMQSLTIPGDQDQIIQDAMDEKAKYIAEASYIIANAMLEERQKATEG